MLYLLAAQGRWTEMPALVDDAALGAFAVVGEPADIGAKLQERGDLATSIAIYQYDGGPAEVRPGVPPVPGLPPCRRGGPVGLSSLSMPG